MTGLAGNVLTPQGFIHGRITFDAHGRIAAIDGRGVGEDEARGNGEPILLPGFIDLHVHGGNGRDVMEGGDAAAAVARCHVRHGTTALLATTMTAPMGDMVRAAEGVRSTCDQRPRDAARVLGLHLEGPYINRGKLGAQPDFARPVAMEELRRLHAIAPVRLITLAPELPGHLEDIPLLVKEGWRVQVGHTLGRYDDGVAALDKGASGFTHLFNAMTAFQHREPGIVGAALAHAQYAEVIPDLLHVHMGAIRVALRSIPNLYCVTDATAATGMPDGEYMLGRQVVTKCLGGVRLPDGTLAGSALTMDRALRNLCGPLALPLADAALRVSTHAANYLGLQDRGRLAPGAWGDVVVLDPKLEVQDVYVEGASIELAHAA